MLPGRRSPLLVLAACATLLLAGCGDSVTEREKDTNPATRVDSTPNAGKTPVRPAPATAAETGPEPAYQDKTLSAWIRQLQDKDKDARIQAAEALGKIDTGEFSPNPVLDALGSALKDKDSTVRFVAAESLRRFGKEAVPVLVEALQDKDPEVRKSAASGIERMAFNAQAAVPTLGEVLLKDSVSEVRSMAAMALGRIGQPSLPTFLTALKSEDAEIRKLAVGYLGRSELRADKAILALGEVALKDKDTEVRRQAASSLGQVGPDARKAVPALAELLKDEDESLRLAAIEALGRTDEAGAALPALLEASKASDKAGKAAREALRGRRQAPRSSAPALLKFLKDAEPHVRLKAAEVLCQLEEGDQECLTCLLELVKRRDPQIHQEAAWLLTRYGSAAKEAVPALIEIVRNASDPNTRRVAIHALGAIGPDAQAAIPELKAAQKDKQVEAAATAALKKIERP